MPMWTRFLIYGMLGWCVEVVWTGLGSMLRRDVRLVGHTYLWMFFIYGLAAPVMEPVHLAITGLPWPVRGMIWVCLTFLIEYVTGWLLRETTGHCPWDYSGTRFAVNGLIRLDYAPAWFVLGLLFEQVHWRLRAITPMLERLWEW